MRRSLAVGIAVVLALTVIDAESAKPREDDATILLNIHNELIDAHKSNDVDRLTEPESDEVISVSRGEVLFQNRDERVPRFKDYLENTVFTEYRDLIDPIVHVSDDGTLGWVIVQVKVSGTRTYSGGESKSFDDVWAWIELYKKMDGRWYRVGDVSNRKPN
ncbi:MAG: hypothetical protein JSW50_02175 [Candidatus Latescibacterota bacterium]|nr:MAG: hypothetical protein JSW50_02175 [Candidatus Latescibacterota bacterium]